MFSRKQRELKEEGERRERKGREGEMRVRRNELKRNAREYTYISGVRETPKEVREDRGRLEMKGEREVGTEGKSEEGRRGREKF